MASPRLVAPFILLLLLTGAAFGVLTAPKVESAPDRPRALGGLLLAPAGAVVVDNKDPDGRGRVKVKFPWLPDGKESTWARIMTSSCSPTGVVLVPEVDDEVLCVFEHGDIHRPVVLGGLWNGR